jgi:NADH dehydrogenase
MTTMTIHTTMVITTTALMMIMAMVMDGRASTIFQRCNAFVGLAETFSVRHRYSRTAAAYSPSSLSSLVLKATQYDRCDVAIFGGGFGGLYTALALEEQLNRKRELSTPSKSSSSSSTTAKTRQSKPVDIVLVDPGDRFVFLPLLYDLTMGTATEGEVCPTYAELLKGTRIRHVKASFDGFVTPNNIAAQGENTIDASVSTARLHYPSHNRQDDEIGEDVDEIRLSFDAAVVSTGATPQDILSAVPGASEYVQPFYTREDAWATRDVLFRLDQKIRRGERPRVAVVGGGYGGVELAACLARRLPGAEAVTLMTRGPPMKGTRAEPLVEKALKRLGVTVSVCSVDRINPMKSEGEETKPGNEKVRVCTSCLNNLSTSDDASINGNQMEEVWDVVFWTAGSAPAYPVPVKMDSLDVTSTGRLSIDSTLRCNWASDDIKTTGINATGFPRVWSLGDCSEITTNENKGSAVPRTAQAAIQQADIVANNIVCTLEGRNEDIRSFQFQDLGTVLSLGGPLAAIVGPKDDSTFGPLFGAVLDTARVGLNVADKFFSTAIQSSPQAQKLGVQSLVDNLGLSLGGYGLGVDPDTAPGTLAGTISGAARRAIYAIRMPTNKQRAYAVASATIATVSSLAKEAGEQLSKETPKDG